MILNVKALERLKALIKAGKYVDGAWNFTAADSNANGEAETEAEPAVSADGDDFDPMAILQAGDSQLPKDDMDIDIEESSHGSQAI